VATAAVAVGMRGGGGPLMVSEDETIIFFVISINRVAPTPL